jgi:leucyl-tRNA synthetase
MIKEYGAETRRTYEMFIGAFDQAANWSMEGVQGCRRFLDRVWKLQDIVTDGDSYSKDLEVKINQTIKKVSGDFETLKYNTGIAALMALINDFYKAGSITKADLKTFITLLNPVAPHITEEIWKLEGFEGRVYQTAWPEYDEAKCVEDRITIAVQVLGKLRGTFEEDRNASKETMIARAKETVADRLEGKEIVKEIYVPGKLVNFVIK